MSDKQQILVSKDKKRLQLPYAEYRALMEKVEDGERIRAAKNEALSYLEEFHGGTDTAGAAKGNNKPDASKANNADASKGKPAQTPPAVEKPAAKGDAPKNQAPQQQKAAPEPAPEPAPKPAAESAAAAKARKLAQGIEIPPIKKDIASHFNQLDESGRLFSVFKQYYSCLNDSCGGTVRVTMKDGFCSLWNYDQWEEFAFVDIFEGHLRIALDPRYTDRLKSLSLCEVPRLLSSRRSLVCVQIDDLNNIMLNVLEKAFKEVGLTAS
ncbi:hypothetical protein [Pontiella sp.]|uniref:hypothetical protein n=1 Tax=Pontiella sp. TaxID=2837462 RepID=UPI003565337A